MEVVADMLVDALKQHESHRCETVQVRPPFRPALDSVLATNKFANNFDRLLNRHLDYLSYLKEIVRSYDYFHIADHSYAALAHSAGADRRAVSRPRCVSFDPEAAAGKAAAVVSHDGAANPRWKCAGRRWCSTTRMKSRRSCLRHAGRAVAIEENHRRACRRNSRRLRRNRASPACSTTCRPYLLHVGHCVSRKRIDVLLNTFAAIRTNFPELLLVKVGGDFTAEHQAIINRFVLEPSMCTCRASIANRSRHCIGTRSSCCSPATRKALACL